MGIFFAYILKSSFCLAGFYLFYKILLSRETFHAFNRGALLLVCLLSFVIPAINIDLPWSVSVSQTVWVVERLLVTQVESAPAASAVSSGFWLRILVAVYLLGILVFWMKHVWSLYRLHRLCSKGQRKLLANGVWLVLHHLPIGPFSWMNYIVLSEKDYQENGEVILKHEMAHVQHHHSIDLLWADFCISLQWFNPAAWLMKAELQSLHEFQADEAVVAQGVDPRQYQLLLIRKAVGDKLFSMANNFNYNALQKRIHMMLQHKSSPWAKLKSLCLLPMVVFSMLLFTRPALASKLDAFANLHLIGPEEIVDKTQEKDMEDKPITSVEHALVLWDGYEVGYGMEAIQHIDVTAIQSVQIITDARKLKPFGPKAKQGIVMFTSRVKTK